MVFNIGVNMGIMLYQTFLTTKFTIKKLVWKAKVRLHFHGKVKKGMHSLIKAHRDKSSRRALTEAANQSDFLADKDI